MSESNQPSAAASFNAASGKLISLAEYMKEGKKNARKEIGLGRRALNGALRLAAAPFLIPAKIYQSFKNVKNDVKTRQKRDPDVYVTKEMMDKINKNPLAAIGLMKHGYIYETQLRATIEKAPPLKLERLIDRFTKISERRTAVIENTINALPDHSADLAAGKIVRFNIN